MKKLSLLILAFGVIATAVAISQQAESPKAAVSGELQVKQGARNPWTHLRLNNSTEEFQFAMVSDRTGGHRANIFSKAVEQLNLLQPEFVVSVGDLIEGYSTDRERVMNEWKEFQGFTSKLEMPFFYVAGNHDITNKEMEEIWKEKFGARYYHFVYKNVLFLMLQSDDPPGTSSISEEQQKYATQVLAENPNVDWTVVTLHKPIWEGNVEKNGWGNIEKALNGRKYTCFAGHVHRYKKSVRQNMNYYQFATTGGGSRLRGTEYGEFDHLIWITMKKTGPVIANLMLDGIVGEDLTLPKTNEEVPQYERKRTFATKGYVYLAGTPAAGATVAFYLEDPANPKRTRFAADAVVEGDGSFSLSTYGKFDGAPAGKYKVVVTFDGRYGGSSGKKELIPEAYWKADTTPLTATVAAGSNEFTFELKK
ncbi:MAG: metallophosphoesterase [Zavarzinella sp.]